MGIKITIISDGIGGAFSACNKFVPVTVAKSDDMSTNSSAQDTGHRTVSPNNAGVLDVIFITL